MLFSHPSSKEKHLIKGILEKVEMPFIPNINSHRILMDPIFEILFKFAITKSLSQKIFQPGLLYVCKVTNLEILYFEVTLSQKRTFFHYLRNNLLSLTAIYNNAKSFIWVAFLDLELFYKFCVFDGFD